MNMKQSIRIYLESEDKKRLLEKAKQSGFEGRGALINFIQKIANEDICFLDENLKKMLKALSPLSQ